MKRKNLIKKNWNWIAWNVDLNVGKFFALRNLMGNLHMLLDILELKVGNKNLSLDKTVLLIWSQIFDKDAKFGLECTLKKKLLWKELVK